MGSTRKGPRRPRAGKQGGAVLSPCVPAHPGDPLTHTLALATRRPELPCQGSGSLLCETHPRSPGLAGQCQLPQTQGNPSHCPHVISLSLLNPLGPSEQRPLPLASASPAHLLSLGGHPHPSGREGLGPPAFYHRARTVSHARKKPTNSTKAGKKEAKPSLLTEGCHTIQYMGQPEEFMEKLPELVWVQQGHRIQVNCTYKCQQQRI